MREELKNKELKEGRKRKRDTLKKQNKTKQKKKRNKKAIHIAKDVFEQRRTIEKSYIKFHNDVYSCIQLFNDALSGSDYSVQ